MKRGRIDPSAAVRHETTPGTAHWQIRPRAPWLPGPKRTVAVAAGGMIGALLRYIFTVMFPTAAGDFPLTTLAENVVGAFLLGLLLVLILERMRPARYLHPFLCTGILGSFTTFSNFTLELVALGIDGQAALVGVYAAASLLLGLAAALGGMSLGRAWPPWVGKEQP